MLRSLVVQVSRQGPGDFRMIEDLFASHGEGTRQPNDKAMLGILREMINRRPNMFIVLDALEYEINEALGAVIDATKIISIESSLTSEDIQAYIVSRVSDDRALRVWRNRPDFQKKIEVKLMAKADAMFRWVEFQLDALGNCPLLPRMREALDTLPPSLDETYSRILCSIDRSNRRLAIKAFQWLVVCDQPLTVEELSEILAIDGAHEPRFDVNRCFTGYEGILSICSSLITITRIAGSDVNARNDSGSSALQYAVYKSHFIIIKLSLDHGANFNASGNVDHGPALTIAAQDGWEEVVATLLHHGADTNAVGHGTALIAAAGRGHSTSTKLLISCGSNVNIKDWHDEKYGTALLTAVKLGYVDLARAFLAEGADVNASTIDWFIVHSGEIVNLVGGPYQSALQAATFHGDEKIVRMLLAKGAEVNMRGGSFETALQASFRGHEAIVELLLLSGANVHCQGGCCGNAPAAARLSPSTSLVQLLLDEGARVEAPTGKYGSVLQAASAGGSAAVVQMLLDRQANVNTQGGLFGSPLQAALHFGNEETVLLLLGNGSDITLQGGDQGGVRETAFGYGSENIIRAMFPDMSIDDIRRSRTTEEQPLRGSCY
ncbi:MAG: hypothetical protein Q9210_003422 [Variospora velana]